MSPQNFDKLLNIVRPKLLKRSRREPLSPKYHLDITLKYLTHGGSFQNLAWEFRIGKSTVMNVINETCEAMWDFLVRIYMKEPSGFI